MDKEERIQWLLDAIQQLEDDGLVDYPFRESYLMKEDSGSRFFLDLISTFSRDFRKVAKRTGNFLNATPVDFNEMKEFCIRLKGSAVSIGACRISAVCSNILHQAIENKSKEECLQAMKNIKREFKNLKYHWHDILWVSDDRKHLILPSLHKILDEAGRA